MVTGPTFECAASLQTSDEQGRLSHTSSLISSALKMITQCARFVEDAAHHDPSLGVLSLAILAKTKASTDADPKIFKLWGPRLPTADKPSDTHSSFAAENIRTSREAEDAEGVFEIVAAENTRSSSVPPVSDQSVSTSSILVPILKSPTGLFQIQDKYNAKCLSLLMDAAGVTSHPNSCQYRTVLGIPSSVLISAARSIMGAFKEKNGLSSKYVKYSSVLPQELRECRVQYSSMALVRGHLGYQVLKSGESVTLSVKKPDRNKKSVHFAMFAILLQIDPQGVCEKQLQEMSLEGLGASGCHTKPGEHCGGPSRCAERHVRAICDFMDESNSLVGSGEVYPLLSYYKGEPVPMDAILMRFSSPQNGVAMENGEEFQSWSTLLVSRVSLLNESRSSVGTAIICLDSFVSESENGIAPNFSDAVIVCDVQISSAHKSDPYMFLELERLGSLRAYPSLDAAVAGKNSPKPLGEFERQTVGFWSRQFLQKTVSL